ncbi:MAG: bleomycin resistance family protein [Saprospiraceae bacterium]
MLGFTCDAYEESWGWASLSLDTVSIMFTNPNPHRKLEKAIMSGSLYIRTNAVEAWWEKLKSACSVCYELEKFDYGMHEFAVYDNNGYLLQFGQEVSTS